MAFAKDPGSNAFVALSAAYLQQGRFMEAMVVCKKGIKSQPDNVEGRLLLARVYAEQGKVPKAIEEVKALLEAKPDVAEGHFLLGQMHERSGRFEEAIEAYKETLRKNRGHGEAAAALKAKGIDWAPGPSPEELAAAEAVRRAAEDEARQQADAQRAQEEQARAAAATAARPPMRPNGPAGASGGLQRPARSSSLSGPQFPQNDPQYQGFAGAYGMFSGPVPVASAHKRLGPGFTFGLGALLLLVVAGVVVGLVWRKGRQEEINEHMRKALPAYKVDTSKAHREAVKELEAALKVDDGNGKVAAYYAYSMAVLAFERGDKELDQRARDGAKRAMKLADDSPWAVAAQMLTLRADNKPDEALALGKRQGDEASAVVPVRVQLGRTYAALGKVAEMVKLADSLKDNADPAALTFVGEAYRRIGDHARARVELDAAIKNNLDHDPARALRALVILEDDDITNLNIAIDDVKSLKDAGKDAVGTKQRGYASLGLALIGKKIGRPDRENDVALSAARSALISDPELPLFEAKQAVDVDAKKAVELAQQAIKLDRVRLEPYLTIVDAATHAPKPQWAIADAALADATAVFGDNLEIGIAKGARLRDEGKYDEAVNLLRAMTGGHDVAEVYREIGKVYLKKGDVPQAVGWLKQAAEKAKNRAPGVQANVYTWLGRGYAEAGDHAQAKAIYAQALAATTDYTATYYWIAVTLKELGEKPAAKDACVKYMRNDPNGPYAERCKTLIQGL